MKHTTGLGFGSRHHGGDKSRPCAVAWSLMLGGARYVHDTVVNALTEPCSAQRSKATIRTPGTG